MSPRAFDRVMISTSIGHPGKLRRRFTPAERWVFVAGVLCIAGDAPVRGCLIVDDEPATMEDVADKAGVTVAVAASTLRKLRGLGMLERDDDLGCERVHDWADFNPEPKDPSNAERQRRWRARNAGRNGTRNEGSNAPHNTGDNAPGNAAPSRALRATRAVSEDVGSWKSRNTPPTPPAGGRQRDQGKYEEEFASWSSAHFPGIEPGYVKAADSSLRRPGRVPTTEQIGAWLDTKGYGRGAVA